MTKEKRGTVIGVIVLVLLIAALAVGGRAVWKAARGGHKQTVQAQPAPQPEQPVTAIPEEPAVTKALPVQDTEPEPEPKPEPEPEPEPTPPPVQTLRLMALGDNLIHNCIYWSAELPEGGYDFTPYYQDIAKTVAEYDLACINQETILVKDAANISSYPDFGTPTEIGDALVAAGFDVVTAATNHCFDKGMTGLKDTLSFWREKYPQITLLGLHETQQDAQSVKVVERNGIRIAMLDYTYGMNAGRPQDKWMIDEFSTYNRIIEDLTRAEQEADLTVVFAHWGEEGHTSPNDYQRTWAQVLADNGADLIIGAHPHVLQPLETVVASDGREVAVYFSLGNFLSHQTEPIELLGGMASVTITKDENGTRVTDCELKPIVTVISRSERQYMFDYRPMLLEDYTPEIAATHRFTECTVETMQSLAAAVLGSR